MLSINCNRPILGKRDWICLVLFLLGSVLDQQFWHWKADSTNNIRLDCDWSQKQPNYIVAWNNLVGFLQVAIMTGNKFCWLSSNCFRREKIPRIERKTIKLFLWLSSLTFCFPTWTTVCCYILINMFPGMATIIAFLKLCLRPAYCSFCTSSCSWQLQYFTAPHTRKVNTKKYLAKHTGWVRNTGISVISVVLNRFYLWVYKECLDCMQCSYFELHFAW